MNNIPGFGHVLTVPATSMLCEKASEICGKVIPSLVAVFPIAHVRLLTSRPGCLLVFILG